MKRFIALGLVLVLLLSMVVGCSSSNDAPVDEPDVSEEPEGNEEPAEEPKEVKTFRLAENQPDNNPVTIAMFKFSELVEEYTDGEIKIEVYPNGQLGEEAENVEQVQSGALEMSRVNSVTLAQTVKELEVFTLPYIFTDQDQKYKVLDGEIGQDVLAKLEDYNMVGFDFLDAGSRNFYTTKKPIKSVADLKGLKIRVQPADVVVKMMELMGAVPTPMNYGEVFSALQTGVIDGAENDFVSFYTSGHYEAAQHYSLDGHLSPPALTIMSKKVWDELSADNQEAMKKAAREAAEFQRVAMNEFQDESRKEVEAAGVTVYDVDVQEFQDAVAPIYDDFPQFKEVIEAIRATK